MLTRLPLFVIIVVLSVATAGAEPLTIDLTRGVVPASASPHGPGTATNPEGQAITADSRSFFLGAKPWIPVAGEFHYARYPRGEWRDELLKMKAGGINVVSTYVFWIFQEEKQGKYDWSGQRSLREFLQLCRELGLKAFVRIGPWCHGEVRNGGFPDWVQNSGAKLRTTDPAFMKLVEPFYRETAKQMEGLLWKDGGPVIGVQVDNESSNTAYLLALKSLAQAVGIDVPFYAMTGWQGGIAKEGLIPLFGGYCDGFWGGRIEDYRREYLFTDARITNDLGAQLVSRNPGNSQLVARFPYACVEIGGGMMSSYKKRIKIDPANVASLALSKLGSGNNMPGYYMYQGGVNPDGALPRLNEEHPNQLPIKDYDFQTALGACGQVREQYHLLRMQHLFLEDFGSALARMPAYFPDVKPSSLTDFNVLRWAVRSDGKSGFLFFNNQQPYVPLPEHQAVQFEVKTNAGSLRLPCQPVTIPTGSYGFWPVNMDCDGVVLARATVQPLCRVATETGEAVYFFAALDGIEPELVFQTHPHLTEVACETEETPDAVRLLHLKPGTTPAVRVMTPTGKGVSFVVLTPQQGRRLWRVSFAGRERAVITDATLLADGDTLRLQAVNPADLAMSMFPTIPDAAATVAKLAASRDGIFTRITPTKMAPSSAIGVNVTQDQLAGPKATSLEGMDDAAWNDAAIYKLDLAALEAGRRAVLNVNYVGDAARLYIGDKLFDDNFYNGDPFSIALWGLPKSQWPAIRLKILPYSDALLARLPEGVKQEIRRAQAAGTLGKVTASVDEWMEWKVSAAPGKISSSVGFCQESR